MCTGCSDWKLSKVNDRKFESGHFWPYVCNSKMRLRGGRFFQFLIICFQFSAVCLYFFETSTASQTHFDFTNIASKGSTTIYFWQFQSERPVCNVMLIAFPYYRKIAYIRVPQSKAIRSTIIRVEVFSRQPRWPCCSVSNEAKSNDCRSNSMGLLDGWVLRFIGHHILSDWRAFDLPESYAKKDSHFQCAAFDILLDAY